MRTNNIVTADNSEPKILSTLNAVLLSMLLSTGFSAMLFSAFKVNFSFVILLIWSGITSFSFAVIHRMNKKAVSLAAMALPFVLLFIMILTNLFKAKEGYQDCLYYIKNYVYLDLPGVHVEPDAESNAFFVLVMLYNFTPISITTYLVTRRRFIPASLVPFLPVFILSVANVVMTPSQSSVVITSAGIIMLLFAHAFRDKKRAGAEKLLLILIVPVFLFTFVMALINPKEGYAQDMVAKSLLTKAREMTLSISPDSDNFVLDIIDRALYGYVEDLPIDTISSSQLTALYASNKNLSAVGPFNPSDGKVMRVYKSKNYSYEGDSRSVYTGNYLYLKVESLDTYKNNILSRANNRIKPYEDGIEITPESAQYSVLITPLIYSDVDITPYYTDYYEMRDTGVANTNLYNITTNGDYYYASSPLPKKSGYIYSEEYLKKYVYDTCLEVPERTRDAITMTGKLPDWYIDCLYGNSTMSDSDKVRAVTSFVSSLHPYDADTEYPPEGADFVPWFIGEAESGICVHYATTSVLLLRMIGIPARYVCGYVDNRSYLNAESVIYSEQAHAWFEFFVPEYGWIMGDATPGYAGTVSNFDINAVAKAYPEIDDAAFSFNRYNPNFNPDDLIKPAVQPEETAETAETSDPTEMTAETSETTPAVTETTPSDPYTPQTGTDITENSTDITDPSSDNAKPKIEFHIDPKVTEAVLSITLKIVIAATVFFLIRTAYVMYWTIKFSAKTMRGRIIAFCHYFRVLHKYLGKEMPRQAGFIIDKVAFSNEKITSKDLTRYIRLCLKSTSMLSRKLPWYKKAFFRLLEIKINLKDQK